MRVVNLCNVFCETTVLGNTTALLTADTNGSCWHDSIINYRYSCDLIISLHYHVIHNSVCANIFS